MRPGRRRAVALLAAAAAASAATVLLAGRPPHTLGFEPVTAGAASWSGFLAPRPRVELAPRAIVVLRTPSLARRLAGAGGRASAAQERSWTAAALGAQQALLARLAGEGIRLRPGLRFARVLDGFAANVAPAAAARVEADPDVAGVYPVRAAFPALLSAEATAALEAGAAQRAPAPPPGLDGRGVTIALLDSKVDRSLRYLHGAVLPQIDLVGGGGDATAEPHGTEMAGLLVGRGGPSGIAGAAPGAQVLPIRVAGLQRDARGRSAVFARTDQLLAGLEHAVDPDGNGDAHDALRVALVPLAEPFAAFPDSPESRGVSGAAALGTLVVAPAGNDGATLAGGDLAAPGAAAAALSVGASDTRTTTPRARVTVTTGRGTYRGVVPLAGTAEPRRTFRLRVARAVPAAGAAAALVRPAGIAAAAAAGAVAALVDGPVPGGADGVDGLLVVPLPREVAGAIRRRLARGGDVEASLAPAAAGASPRAGAVAPFSSTGPSSGRTGPDVVAAGIGLVTSAPGRGWVAVSGTSAAAALVAGAAASLVEARRWLSAQALRGLLAGTASARPGVPLAVEGAGAVRTAAAATAPVAATPALVSLDRDGRGSFALTNVSRSAQELTLDAPGAGVAPRAASLASGASIQVAVRSARTAQGAVRVRASGRAAIAVPWSRRAAQRPVALLGRVSLSARVFSSADTAPATLTVAAGSAGGRGGVVPLARLDLVLLRGGRRLGVLARLRDVLPGRYRFGLTGRGPDGAVLRNGSYAVEVVAIPVDRGSPARRKLRFDLR